MDKEKKMVVVNMDVGNRNATGKSLHIVLRNSPCGKLKSKNFDSLSILKSNSACMAHRKKLQ